MASTVSFMLYATLKYPGVADAMTRETDRLFAGDGPTPAGLRAMDVTPRVAMEAMRLWSIVPALTRPTTRSIAFAGHMIPAATDLIIATTVPHHLAESLPEPERFDIDRCLPERKEHRMPCVYVPFDPGPHSCLGQGMAEMQMALTMAILFHYPSMPSASAN